MGTGLKFVPPSGAIIKKVGSTVGTYPVCEDMADVIPSGCDCVDTNEGGTVSCLVDLNGLDTIVIEVEMNVCAMPMEVKFVLTSMETNVVFSYSVYTGEEGSVPTGIFVGVPGVGDVQIYLIYDLEGNIEALSMLFGFDIGLTVFGYTSFCGDYYPDQCPVYVLTETINLGGACS